MSESVVGVDMGGTRARACVMDRRGRVVGKGEGPGGVLTVEEAAAAADRVRAVVERALDGSNAGTSLRVLWVGAAGGGSVAARDALRDQLEGRRVADEAIVGTDVEAAFHDAFGLRGGVLLIAGTGSIALARDGSGGEVRVGGWGRGLGDEGSAFAIGREALRAVLLDEDGRGPPTVLSQRIPDRLHLLGASALAGWYRSAEKADVGSLATLVLEAVDARDEVAGGIVAEAIDQLALHVEATERRLPTSSDHPVALAGGLLESNAVRLPLIEALSHRGRRVLPEVPRGDLGAAALARAAAGWA